MIIVVGGGAAGMMAALSIRKNIGNTTKRILILEQNEKVAKKIYITGKGRCNVTNACEEIDFLENVVNGEKFFRSAFSSFNNKDAINLLENNGLELVVERGNRVFPKSQKSSDVIATFLKMLNENNIEILYKTKVNSIKKNEEFEVITNNGIFKSEYVVIATGGYSYKGTGSTGIGYKIAMEFGHTIIEPKPTLVPLVTRENISSMSGLSLKNVEVTLKKNDKKIASQFGEMLFTHFGLSGPIILSISSIINSEKISKKMVDRQVVEYNKFLNSMVESPRDELKEILFSENYKLSIDLKPALSFEKLENRLCREISANINKNINNILPELLPHSLVEYVLERAEIDLFKKANSITKKERRKLVNTIKELEFEIIGTRGFNEAIVTSGGINRNELNKKTLESKIIENLYFAGEIIDVDALTGGYNLQIAYSTGYLVGKSISEKIIKN